LLQPAAKVSLFFCRAKRKGKRVFQKANLLAAFQKCLPKFPGKCRNLKRGGLFSGILFFRREHASRESKYPLYRDEFSGIFQQDFCFF
jgi:hypothetical protein